MKGESMYSSEYSESWALVIGINEYQNVPRLAYAKNDAEAVAHMLVSKFSFAKDKVTTLTDGHASRDAIKHAFLRYAHEDVQPNDRLVVFFAGHGFTQRGHRGEVGFLVPVEGSTDDLSSLVRWDELLNGADLIAAKHILFLMDACYGGLAITRALPPGSMRFLRDMLRRFSRQAITAGKADEPVADAGGPLPEHSVFTGHLLGALEGGASNTVRPFSVV